MYILKSLIYIKKNTLSLIPRTKYYIFVTHFTAENWLLSVHCFQFVNVNPIRVFPVITSCYHFQSSPLGSFSWFVLYMQAKVAVTVK